MKDEELKLTRQKVQKDGRTYLDLCLNWTYNGKSYSVRIDPRFARDITLLFAIADPLPTISK